MATPQDLLGMQGPAGGRLMACQWSAVNVGRRAILVKGLHPARICHLFRDG